MLTNRSLRSAVPWLMSLAALAPSGRAADGAPPAQEKMAAEGAALLRTWVPPVYPKAELKARHSGMVTVRLVIDENGRVARARALEDSDEAFVDAALTAVKAWGFAPAISGGQPVASCVDTLVAFSPAVGQQKASAIPPSDQRLTPPPRTSPKVRVSPDGEYPKVLVERRIPGRVRFNCLVTKEGRATNGRALAATHVDFVPAALEGLAQWEFSPAMEGDLEVPGPVDGVATFDNIDASGAETLAANGVTGPDGQPPAITPMPLSVVDPVWPLDCVLQGEGGSATVEFRVTETGYVRDVRVWEASAPEFGEALRAAVELWAFERPIQDNHVVDVALRKHAEFKAIPLEVTDESDALARLVQRLRRGEIATAKGLDERLTPLYRLRPEYPASLKGPNAPKGAAEIELVIDREGRARLPRILSATQPEFGWAAATAVSNWVFKAPRKGGEVVEVKVKIPIEFAAPVE